MSERGTRVSKNCAACGEIISVRLADHKRGWGKFCDKECAATYKNGNRPHSVNKDFAKHSPWAARKLQERAEHYGGESPPKAPSIKEQLGHNPKVRKMKRRATPRPYVDLDDFDDLSWDAHKFEFDGF